MIQTFTYTGITNTNYNQSGFFHSTNSRNALINVMVRKVLNQVTKLLWQVSFSPVADNFPEKYWADVSWWGNNFGAVNLPSTSPAEWGILLNYNAPFSGITGVRIIPQDNKTSFVMTIIEYYPPTQIAQLGQY